MNLKEYLDAFSSDEAIDIIMRMDHTYLSGVAIEQVVSSFKGGSKISFLAIDTLGYSRPTSDMASVEKFIDGLVVFPTVDNKPNADLHFMLSKVMIAIKSIKRDKLISYVLC